MLHKFHIGSFVTCC